MPYGIIIFGASGDLARRKLLPSVFSLYSKNLLPQPFFILGLGRTEYDDISFRNYLENREVFSSEAFSGLKADFLQNVYYLSGDYESGEFYSDIMKKIEDLEFRRNMHGHRLFYMATPPGVYCKILAFSAENGLIGKEPEHEMTRVVVEKPFGHDLKSAERLDDMISENLNESQIYRIDHYLGKETVQNILMFRFANSIFEPLWNRQYIESIWISADEESGVGSRAGYFDKAGQLRDMFQNHMMQLLSLTAMEPPSYFRSDLIRDEKVKLLKAIRPFTKEGIDENFVRGVYTKVGSVKGYLQETGVSEDSFTETFAAGKFFVDNHRWKDVPFYLRSGKRMNKKETKIVVKFRPVSHSIFPIISSAGLSEKNVKGSMPGNLLVFNVQPEEGIKLKFQAKHPGPKLCMSSITMDFNYEKIFGSKPPEAYERLLMDVMAGDQTLFIRHDDMRISWELFDPVLAHWKEMKKNNLYEYPSGENGPEETFRVLKIKESGWDI